MHVLFFPHFGFHHSYVFLLQSCSDILVRSFYWLEKINIYWDHNLISFMLHRDAICNKKHIFEIINMYVVSFLFKLLSILRFQSHN